MKEIKIRDKIISENSPIFFIAEIGINHNGSLEIAKKLIDLANTCGADAVKFQKRMPEISVPEHKKKMIYETPWGDIPYLEYKKRVELSQQDFEDINEYCKDKNLIWFASPWDLPSVHFLEKFNVPCYKIASAKLTDRKLLETVSELNKPIFISTGMSTEEDIQKAIKVLENNEVVLMHCTSSYPAKEEDLNLSYILTLKKKYPNCIIGYSGHEVGLSSSVVAACLGAKVIERHITLDRSFWGSDQSASLEFPGLYRLVRDVKKMDLWKGDGIKKISEDEIKLRSKLRNKNTL